MGAMTTLLRRVRAFLRRDRLDEALREELAQHVAWRAQALEAEGIPADEARRRAAVSVGNVTRLREESRDMWGFPTLDSIVQDLRYGARVLRRSPAFAVVAVVSLGLGIGAAAAVFSLSDAVLFRTLAVRDPESLVLLRWHSGPVAPFNSLNGYGQQDEAGMSSTSFSYAAYEAFRRDAAQLIDVVGFADLYYANLAVDGWAERGTAHAVSGNYFEVLGVRPSLGRALAEPDDRVDAAPAAVISDAFWRRRFGAAADAVGRSLDVNGVRFTIAGVLPSAFHGTGQVGTDPDVYVPLAAKRLVVPSDDPPMDPNFWWVLTVGRLKPGVTMEAARGALDVILKRTVAAARPSLAGAGLPGVALEPGGRGQTEERASLRDPLSTMGLIAMLVLLVACANVASLLLARGRARVRELSVRAAMGGSRWRIVRQLLTEASLVAALGGILGVVLAQWLSRAMAPAIGLDADAVTTLTGVDARVLLFAVCVAAAAALLFGVLPAFRSADVRLSAGLQEGGRTGTPSRKARALSGALVAAQIALSLPLVAGAGLLVRSLWNLQRVDVGFDASHLLLFQVDPSLSGYDEVRTRQLIDGALERLRATPGVVGASLSNHKLLSNSATIGVASRPDEVAPAEGSADLPAFERRHLTWQLTVDERFFETMRIPVRHGRTFAAADAGGPPVAVINATLARRLFGTTEAVGRLMRTGSRRRPGTPDTTIIGVVADSHYTNVRSEVPATAYLYYRQLPVFKSAVTFEVRTAGAPSALAGTVREVMRGLDRNVPVFGMLTQDEQIRSLLRQERVFATLSSLLAGIGLLLSAIGLYGLLAYAVTQRTPEIGIRMALGAERRTVLWMVLRQSLVLTAIGLAAGVPAAVFGTSVLDAMLFGLPPRDAITMSIAALVMLATAVAAAAIPARRAARVDPLVALRT